MSYRANNLKNALHGFFLSVATTVAEPSTILPLIIHHFSSSLIVVGLFTALLRGGAIIVQLFAAFYAQSYNRVMPYLRIVFFFRFFSWFLIGLAIFLFGDEHKKLTLWLIGIGLFLFSFSAGFGGIYFKEIIAKVFTKKERGITMANRQLFSSLGAVLSGGVAGWVLSRFEAPMSYAYLFMISSFLMALGLAAFATVKEPPKKSVSKRERSFLDFLKNAYALFISDRRLRLQVVISLMGYAFLLSLPFIILKAKESFALTGWLVGGFITIQMIGSMAGNLFLWKRFVHRYIRMIQLSYLLMIVAFCIALFASLPWHYVAVFFLFGVAIDGFRNSDMNLILEIAPEEKRPVYVAIQSTLTSVGVFFSVPGGWIVETAGYTVLYLISVLLLAIGIYMAERLQKFSGFI
ncbi:MAG: MFS transporter [Campylobacteraceae bacterium 4484_4]|nr:MAG: MFS transporter [Campylobacteraceae bacterium 4484_4]